MDESTPFEVLVTLRVTGTTSPAGNDSLFYKDVEVCGVTAPSNVSQSTRDFAESAVAGLLRHGGKP